MSTNDYGYTISKNIGQFLGTADVTDYDRAVFQELNEASYSEPPAPQALPIGAEVSLTISGDSEEYIGTVVQNDFNSEFQYLITTVYGARMSAHHHELTYLNMPTVDSEQNI